MKSPTANSITQREHGPYKAVDYSAKPDPRIFAPEDGEIVAFAMNGDAGLQIQMKGANGRHGFAHTDPDFKMVKVGDKVKKGQVIGVMGHTGLTVPPGPQGKHLHWTLLTPGGYVYPPSKVTEPFGGGMKHPEGEGCAKADSEGNYWHQVAEDRLVVIHRLENQVQDLEKRVKDLTALLKAAQEGGTVLAPGKYQVK